MDTSKFKAFASKLSFIREYFSLVLPVFIIVLAVFALMPGQLMNSMLKAKMEKQSVAIGRKITSMSTNVVASRQWEVEQSYQQAYKNDADQISLLAKQSTQRPLLSYKIFPKPESKSGLIFEEFGKGFDEKIDELLLHINANDCPTDADFERSLYLNKDSQAATNNISNKIQDVLCMERAESIRVYCDPYKLSGYEFWSEYEYAGMDNALTDSWYAQLAYWIFEDIIETVDTINSKSKNVTTSPVKRILTINFGSSNTRSGLGRQDSWSDRPGYAMSAKSGLSDSLTGRFGDRDIDVIHFRVAVVVRTNAVLRFIDELCTSKRHKFKGFSGDEPEQKFKHNQITVLENTISPVIRKDAKHLLYRYGEDAIVEMNLVCEYVFNKKGYEEIKPELIKNASEEERKIIQPGIQQQQEKTKKIQQFI